MKKAGCQINQDFFFSPLRVNLAPLLKFPRKQQQLKFLCCCKIFSFPANVSYVVHKRATPTENQEFLKGATFLLKKQVHNFNNFLRGPLQKQDTKSRWMKAKKSFESVHVILLRGSEAEERETLVPNKKSRHAPTSSFPASASAPLPFSNPIGDI